MSSWCSHSCIHAVAAQSSITCDERGDPYNRVLSALDSFAAQRRSPWPLKPASEASHENLHDDPSRQQSQQCLLKMPAHPGIKKKSVLYQNKFHLFCHLHEVRGPTDRDLSPFYPRERIISIMYVQHACVVPFIGFAPFQAVLYLKGCCGCRNG